VRTKTYPRCGYRKGDPLRGKDETKRQLKDYLGSHNERRRLWAVGHSGAEIFVIRGCDLCGRVKNGLLRQSTQVLSEKGSVWGDRWYSVSQKSGN